MARHGNQKVWLTRWPGGDVHFQCNGIERSMAELKRSVLADMEAAAEFPVRVDALDVYVKAEDGRAYYVASGNDGSCGMSGSVAL